MNFYFHEEAESEFLEAIEYYEECEIGLGIRFSKEVNSTIYRICHFPNSWEKIDAFTHRCLVNKFPYGILYRIVDEQIRIMAVMHLNRKPGYWMERK